MIPSGSGWSKQDLRHDMRIKRNIYASDPGLPFHFSSYEIQIKLKKIIINFLLSEPDAWVGLTWPLKEEIDLRPLLFELYAMGVQVALPVVIRKNAPLRFHAWHENARFEKGMFGTLHPVGAPVIPRFICVPLLAFDRNGYRLGYGGGFYDRTLALFGKRTHAWGYGYSWQEVNDIPHDKLDVRLNGIVTEKEIIHLS